MPLLTCGSCVFRMSLIAKKTDSAFFVKNSEELELGVQKNIAPSNAFDVPCRTLAPVARQENG